MNVSIRKIGEKQSFIIQSLFFLMGRLQSLSWQHFRLSSIWIFKARADRSSFVPFSLCFLEQDACFCWDTSTDIMTPKMHFCCPRLVFKVYVLWMSCLYVVWVAALWMVQIQLRPHVRQILMQTLHLNFGCKDEYMSKEQERLRFAPVKRAAVDYGRVGHVLHSLTDSQQSWVWLRSCCFMD